MTMAGKLHQFGGSALFAGLVGAPLVLARWLAREGHRGWAAYGTATGVLVAASATAAGVVYRLETAGVLSGGSAGGLERVAFALGFAWITLLYVRLTREVGGL